MPAENKIGAGTPDWLSGAITCTAPAPGRGRSAGGAGGVGEIGGQCMGLPPRPRPARALTTISPAPARGPWGRASMVLFDGEGVPSPAPPRVISPRSGAWGDAGEEYNRGCFPGPAFPGLSSALPLPPATGASGNAGERQGPAYPEPSPTPEGRRHGRAERSCEFRHLRGRGTG